MRRILVCASAAALLVVPLGAQTLWGDDFENSTAIGSPSGPYPTGASGSKTFPAAGGIGNAANAGWDCWYLAIPNAAGNVSTAFAHSGTRSLECSGLGVGGSGCDMVYQWDLATNLVGNPAFFNTAAFPPGTWPASPTYAVPPTSPGGLGGIWRLKAWIYHPSSLPTGTASSYWILNDVLNNATSGVTRWVGQIQFNHVTGKVADDQRPASNSGPCIQYDTWVEVATTFDLDNGLLSTTYGGEDCGTGPYFVTVPAWNVGTGPRQLTNLDFYTSGATMFGDDFILEWLGPSANPAATPPTHPTYEANSPVADAQLGGRVGNFVGRADTRAVQGSLVTLTLTSSVSFGGPPVPSDFLYNGGVSPPLGGGGFALGDGQTLNLDPFTAGWLGGTPFVFSLPHPGGGAALSFTFGVPTIGLNGCSPPQTPPTSAVSIAHGQFAILDPAALFGFSLSQPVNLWISG